MYGACLVSGFFRSGKAVDLFNNAGLQAQSVCFISRMIWILKPRFCFTPIVFSDDGTVSLNSFGVSEDG